MSDIIYKKGNDVKLEISIRDDNGSPVVVGPVTSGLATDIQVKLMVGSTVLEELSVSGGEVGYHATKTDTVTCYLTSEQTKNHPTGALKAITIVYFADADFSDGNRKEQFSRTLGTIVEPNY